MTKSSTLDCPHCGEPIPLKTVRKHLASEGGKAKLAKHGKEAFSRMGKKGGEKLKEKRGKEYYSRLGKLSAKKRKEQNQD